MTLDFAAHPVAELRAGTPTDAGRTGHILYRFQVETDWMPELYSEAEVISFCGTMIDRGWVYLAEQDGAIAGFMALDGEELSCLYVAAEFQGMGIGKQLVDFAKSSSPRLELRTFQANVGAQRFYHREGFVEVGRGDGSTNEEGLPDILYCWTSQAQAGARKK